MQQRYCSVCCCSYHYNADSSNFRPFRNSRTHCSSSSIRGCSKSRCKYGRKSGRCRSCSSSCEPSCTRCRCRCKHVTVVGVSSSNCLHLAPSCRKRRSSAALLHCPSVASSPLLWNHQPCCFSCTHNLDKKLCNSALCQFMHNRAATPGAAAAAVVHQRQKATLFLRPRRREQRTQWRIQQQHHKQAQQEQPTEAQPQHMQHWPAKQHVNFSIFDIPVQISSFSENDAVRKQTQLPERYVPFPAKPPRSCCCFRSSSASAAIAAGNASQASTQQRLRPSQQRPVGSSASTNFFVSGNFVHPSLEKSSMQHGAAVSALGSKHDFSRRLERNTAGAARSSANAAGIAVGPAGAAWRREAGYFLMSHLGSCSCSGHKLGVPISAGSYQHESTHTTATTSTTVAARGWELVQQRRAQQRLYGDNIVDNYFLEGLLNTSSSRSYRYADLVQPTVVITQHLSLLVIFAVVYARLQRQKVEAAGLVILSFGLLLLGHLLRWRLDPSLNSALRGVLTSLIGLGCLRVVTPILRTLTESFSDDTVISLSIGCFLLHVALTDYTYVRRNPGKLDESLCGAMSLNAALSATVVLASRLFSSSQVFGVLFFGIEMTALSPLMRRMLWHWHPKLFVRVLTPALVLVTAALLHLEVPWSIVFLYLFLVAFITFVGPYWLISSQIYKHKLRGPWDIAAVPQIT